MKRSMRTDSHLESMQALPEHRPEQVETQGWKKPKKHDHEQEPGQVEVRWVNLKRNRVGFDFNVCEEEEASAAVALRKPAQPTSQAPSLSPVRLPLSERVLSCCARDPAEIQIDCTVVKNRIQW